MKRHQTSKKLSLKQVQQVNETTWTVKSQDLKNEYTVVRASCKGNCALKCQECNACIHTYYCNCMDAQVHHSMCKHIHLVAITQPEAPARGQSSKRLESTQAQLPLLHALQKKGNCSNLHTVRERVLRTLSTLTAQITQCTSVEGLLATEKHIIIFCKEYLQNGILLV